MEQTQPITVVTPQSTLEQGNAQIQYSGFWKRVLAAIIDGLVVGTVAGFIAFIFGSSSYTHQQGLVQAFVSWLYFAYMESSVAQATLGKQILGMSYRLCRE